MQAWLPTAEHNANRPQKSKQAIRPDKAGDSNVRLNIFPLSQSLFYSVHRPAREVYIRTLYDFWLQKFS